MDLKTIFICLFIINLFLGLFTFVIKRTENNFPGITYWIVSNIFIAIVYLLLFLRSSIPDFFSIVLANNLFLLAFIIRIYGLKRFFNQNFGYSVHILSLITLTIFFILFIFFTYQHNSIFIRTIISGTFSSGAATIIGFLILKNKSNKNQFSYIFTASVFFLFSILFISRIIGWILFPEIRNLFTSALVNNLQFLSSLIIDITWTTMFFVMHNQKLTYELTDSEQLLSLFIKESPIYTFIKETTANESKVLFASENYIDMIGITGSEMKGKNMHEIFPSEFAQKITNDDWKVISDGKILKLDEELNGKNYITIKFPIIQNERKFLAGYTINITDEKRTEQLLIEAREKAEFNEKQIKNQKEQIELQNERLESLLRISQYQTNSIQKLLDFALEEAIQLTKSKIGYIYFYNESTRQFILNTWSKDVMKECAVQNPQTIYDLDSTGCWGEAVRQKKPIVLNNYQSENPSKKGIPEGHVKLTKFLTIPVFSDNKIVAVAGVANKTTDYDNSDIRQLTLLMDNVWKISERITFIDKLNSAKERAELSEKELSELNATKDKLFSIIAHDLKSPFSSILGFSELLSKNIQNRDFEQAENFIGLISSSAKSTFNLLNSLLDWAKSQTGQLRFDPKLLNLSDIVKPIIHEQNFAAEIKKITINFSQLNEYDVFADQNMLETIFRNLISNAIKYSNIKGKIDIQAVKKKDLIEISVSDNGIGMSLDKITKLFIIGEQESVNGTSGERGSGLGLILCKDFVEKNGGKIWVESEPEKGSIFYFTLPNNMNKTK